MRMVQIEKDYRAYSKETLSQVKALYEESFPYEERRSWEDLNTLFRNGQGELVVWLDGGLVAFAVVYRLRSSLFIEYLCTASDLRGQGIGAKMIKELGREYIGTPLLLECEPPSLSHLAKRRFAFYQRLGFSTISETYLQPAYHADSAPVPLFLLVLGGGESDGRLLEGELLEFYASVLSF